MKFTFFKIGCTFHLDLVVNELITSLLGLEKVSYDLDAASKEIYLKICKNY